MWLAGTPTRVIAETLKISADKCDVTRRALKLPKRESWHNSKSGHRKAYIPSEDEIKEKCAQFQAGWTDEERALRFVGGPVKDVHVEVRVISESVLRSGIKWLGEDSGGQSTVEDLADRGTSG